MLQTFCNKHEWVFEDRLKTELSFAQRVELNIGEINDVYASTIIVPSYVFVNQCVELFKEAKVYKIKLKQQKPENLTIANSNASEFLFNSVRLYCSIDDCDDLQTTNITNTLFEIQIKTFLEHAWDKAAHDTLYKTDKVLWSKERLFSQAKAMLENVELILSEHDSLSKSVILNKKNKKLNKIIDKVLKLSKLKQNDLKDILTKETALNRGACITNLSPYWVCFQSIGTDLGWETFLKKINSNLPNNGQKFMLISELDIPDSIDLSKYGKMTMLQS
ncbi:MAG: hypothetical protein Rsou_0376 [Candidatus Ruthia sp. Asou_11_S2]|nr:hypothetical protein [Candidatus Ruthia sp. Asou_11_S2]